MSTQPLVPQGTLDRLSLALLACLPETDPSQLGGLSWGLGKVTGRLGETRLHPQVTGRATGRPGTAVVEVTRCLRDWRKPPPSCGTISLRRCPFQPIYPSLPLFPSTHPNPHKFRFNHRPPPISQRTHPPPPPPPPPPLADSGRDHRHRLAQPGIALPPLPLADALRLRAAQLPPRWAPGSSRAGGGGGGAVATAAAARCFPLHLAAPRSARTPCPNRLLHTCFLWLQGRPFWTQPPPGWLKCCRR